MLALAGPGKAVAAAGEIAVVAAASVEVRSHQIQLRCIVVAIEPVAGVVASVRMDCCSAVEMLLYIDPWASIAVAVDLVKHSLFVADSC